MIRQVEKELDREEQEVHVIVVRATEQCTIVPDMIDFFDPADDTLLKVVVNVNDINDNRPVFVKRNSVHLRPISIHNVSHTNDVADVFTAGLTAEANFGAQMLCVMAVDADSEKNSMLTYHLRQPIRSTVSDGTELVESNPFVIDKHSGCISLNFDPQRNMKGYFDMEVAC